MTSYNALELFSLGLPRADVRRKELKGKAFRTARDAANAIGQHVRDWRDLQLVLGVKADGTAHLLITNPDRTLFRLSFHHGELIPAASFKSFSPIQIEHQKHLFETIQDIQDRRFANRESGISATAEQARSFWCIISGRRLRLFRDLKWDRAWSGGLKAAVFLVANRWIRDVERRGEDRIHERKLLDISWAHARSPYEPFTEGLELQQHSYVVIEENSTLGIPGKRKASSTLCEETELNLDECRAKLWSYIQELSHLPTNDPVVVVSNEPPNILEEYGFSVAGLEDLIVWDYRPPSRHSRSRSKSPLRSGQLAARPRSRSPPPSSQKADLYFLDINTLFTARFGGGNYSRDLADMCCRLGIPAPVNEWNASNEVLLLRKLFDTILGGPPLCLAPKEAGQPTTDVKPQTQNDTTASGHIEEGPNPGLYGRAASGPANFIEDMDDLGDESD